MIKRKVNKTQKRIISVWIILLALLIILTLNPVYITGPYLPPEGVFNRYSINYYDFGVFGGILSAVMLILFYLWKDKYDNKKS